MVKDYSNFSDIIYEKPCYDAIKVGGKSFPLFHDAYPRILREAIYYVTRRVKEDQEKFDIAQTGYLIYLEKGLYTVEPTPGSEEWNYWRRCLINEMKGSHREQSNAVFIDRKRYSEDDLGSRELPGFNSIHPDADGNEEYLGIQVAGRPDSREQETLEHLAMIPQDKRDREIIAAIVAIIQDGGHFQKHVLDRVTDTAIAARLDFSADTVGRRRKQMRERYYSSTARNEHQSPGPEPSGQLQPYLVNADMEEAMRLHREAIKPATK